MAAIKQSERHAFTLEFMKTVIPNSVPVGPFCSCSEKPYPHPAHTEEEAVFEYHRSLRREVQDNRPANRMQTTERSYRRTQRVQLPPAARGRGQNTKTKATRSQSRKPL